MALKKDPAWVSHFWFFKHPIKLSDLLKLQNLKATNNFKVFKNNSWIDSDSSYQPFRSPSRATLSVKIHRHSPIIEPPELLLKIRHIGWQDPRIGEEAVFLKAGWITETEMLHLAAKNKTTCLICLHVCILYTYTYHVMICYVYTNMQEASSADGGFSRNNKAECIKQVTKGSKGQAIATGMVMNFGCVHARCEMDTAPFLGLSWSFKCNRQSAALPNKARLS